MELKDVILSTLAEMEDNPQIEAELSRSREKVKSPKEVNVTVEEIKEEIKIEVPATSTESELIYLNSIKERLLVLFEGFQAPNNVNIEAKVDMTLNFLEYTLATIDDRVEKLKKGSL